LGVWQEPGARSPVPQVCSSRFSRRLWDSTRSGAWSRWAPTPS